MGGMGDGDVGDVGDAGDGHELIANVCASSEVVGGTSSVIRWAH